MAPPILLRNKYTDLQQKRVYTSTCSVCRDCFPRNPEKKGRTKYAQIYIGPPLPEGPNEAYGTLEWT